MKVLQPTAAHVAFMDDLKAAVARHQALTAQELLAITCQLVGNMIAYQDRTRFTPEQVMELVGQNIEQGNAGAVANYLGQPKGHA